ncbi:hypothetical protein UCRPC4_g06666 [Phaeomoniella chlamydospora]|uniref:H-type lectin domain-containing protein n=1 Tax=Phaeomoniella chlamydospora TaxID=158046 RepID=A0A0G2DVD6_PHACM|nr:hypothetical protein UCRPC4_g06666 [Phaeomoniella chlamydospora]
MLCGWAWGDYTQTLCINDAVLKPGGKRASENDLRVATHQDNSNAAAGDSTGINRDSQVLSSNFGSVTRLSSDGQMDVSQVVTWEAKFVDKISEVTDSMDIKGSLAIKVDAIGGGGGASGYFVDSNKFKESDINYLIQVKVVNQKLIADDVTQFAPIKNIPPSQFTDVYGDSYISGYLEGGVFNALISIKYTDKSKLKKFGGSLDVDLDFKVASVKGTAAGGKTSEEKSTDKETTINVSWSGGGDIKPDNVKEWNMETLLQVAMEFPDRVAKCPQRTSAILTKYTGLRSFYEQSIKGSPLDYENAGVYSSALLDAYMDYKLLWKNIQTTIWEVDNGVATVKAREKNNSLTAYANDFSTAYSDQLKLYEDSKKPQKDDAQIIEVYGSTETTKKVMEKPLPPNKVAAYDPDIFGLDKAKRDCRFEMIKIVRETKESVDKQKESTTKEELERKVKALQEDYDKSAAEKQKYEKALVDAKKAQSDAENLLEISKKSTSKVIVAPRSGVYSAPNWSTSRDTYSINPVAFDPPFEKQPRMISGLSHIDTPASEAVRVAISHENVTNSHFEAFARAFGGSFAYGIASSWMTLPENDIHMETGVFDTLDFPRFNSEQIVSRVTFSKKFTRKPIILVWLFEINLTKGWHSITTDATTIREDAFDLKISTWAGRNLDGARVGWLAYDANEHDKRIKSGRITVTRQDHWKKSTMNFEGSPFSKQPATFIALSLMDCGDDQNLRFACGVDSVTTTSMNYHCGTWAAAGSDNMHQTEYVWVAME